MTMRISGSVHCGRSWPLCEALPALRELGYEAVELSWARVEREFGRARDPVATIGALLEEHGLALSGLNVVDMTATRKSELDQAVSSIRHQMGLARTLGLAGVNLRGGDRRRQSLVMLTTGLDLVLGEAEEVNLDVCLANARDSRVEQLDDLRYVFIEADHPQLRVLNDAGQFHESAVNPRDAIAEFGDRMSVLRLTDRIGRRCVPLGEGEMNVPAIVEHARRIGYAGWVVVEADLPDVEGTRRYLAEAMRCLRGLLSEPG